MSKRLIILTSIIGGIILLSISLVFLKHKFEETQSPGVSFVFEKFDYVLGIITTLIFVIIPAFVLGFFAWLLFKHKQREKVFYFILFSLIGLGTLISFNSYEVYKIWHYKHYQANIDYNQYLTKRWGSYLDTCFTLVQKDLQKTHGISSNDYRIVSYSYDVTLATIPRDTSNRFFEFDIIYRIEKEQQTVRAASYLINFDERIKRLYDVDATDEKAKKQIDSLKADLKDLKDILQKYPSSNN